MLIRALLIDSVVAVLTPACLYLLLRQRLPPVVLFNALLVLPLAHLLAVWEPRLSKLDTGGRIRSGMVIALSSVLLNAYLLYQAGVLLSPWCLVARVLYVATTRVVSPLRPGYAIADVLAPVLVHWFAGNMAHDWRLLLIELHGMAE